MARRRSDRSAARSMFHISARTPPSGRRGSWVVGRHLEGYPQIAENGTGVEVLRACTTAGPRTSMGSSSPIFPAPASIRCRIGGGRRGGRSRRVCPGEPRKSPCLWSRLPAAARWSGCPPRVAVRTPGSCPAGAERLHRVIETARNKPSTPASRRSSGVHPRSRLSTRSLQTAPGPAAGAEQSRQVGRSRTRASTHCRPRSSFVSRDGRRSRPGSS